MIYYNQKTDLNIERSRIMKNKNVLVTGASRGIGRAIAITFAEAGWSVGVCCRHSTSELDGLKEGIESQGGRCFCYTGDMGIYENARDFVAEASGALGPIDCLVNNAGISHIGLLSDMSPLQWQQILQTNLTSVFNCSHEVIPGMVARQSGSIINISSVWGICGASCEVAYSASKGGVNSFTRALAKELAPSHIMVNAIACGAIDTQMNQFLSPEERARLIDEIPACRMGQPEEVGRLTLQLAGNHPYLTGQVITLDGSWI